MKKSKKVLALALAALMAVSAFGCNKNGTTDESSSQQQTSSNTTKESSSQQQTSTPKPATKLSILLPYGDHAYDDTDLTIEFRNRLQTYTNTDITWELYDSISYYEKLTLKYASGELATIMVTDKNAEFLNAAQYNVFWEISDYIDLFDNLTTIPDATRADASQNGKLYGVPRSRDVGRNVCGFRQDWADNLGLGFPETLEDLYNMAVAFTNNDPDGNGKNDTYGFALDGWTGEWEIMQPWFGVHNTWGYDDNGNLEYYATQEEYKTALKTFRQWYSEGLMPADFTSISAGASDKQLLRTNMCGISIQVADQPRKAQEAMVGTEEAPGLYPEARFTYFYGVDCGYGIRTKSNTSFAGYVSIVKSLAPTEDDLMAALDFLNSLNDAEMRNLIDFGLEGKDYYIDENGYAVRYNDDERTAMGTASAKYREGYNQMVPYFSNEEESAKLLAAELSEMRTEEARVKKENMKYVVANYGASYTSDTYVNIGADLDAILMDAKLNYIQGIIDDTALQAALDQWLEAGGQTVIDEMNVLYQQYK